VTITQIILIMLIFAVITALIIFIILTYNKDKLMPKTGKLVRNHLSKFNNDLKNGSFISMNPVGKDKNLRKIIYATRKKDEHGEEKIIYEIAFAPKRYILEDYNEIQILPKTKTELDQKEPQIDFLNQQIEKANDWTLFTEAEKIKTEKYNKLFIENYGGELSQLEISKIKQLQEAIIEKKEETKSEAPRN